MDLKQHIDNCGLSRAQIAERLGVAESALSMWATGARRVPPTRVVSLAVIVGVRPHEIRPDIFPAPIAPAIQQEAAQ